MQIITRAEAKALGLKRYFTGKPCKHGHVAERVLNGTCIPCQLIKSGIWKNNNIKKVKEKNFEWRVNNLEKINKWTKENRHLINAKTNKRRRCLKLGAVFHEVYKKEIDFIYWTANKLSEITGVKHSVDHQFPVQHKLICGLHVPQNLKILTVLENTIKHNKFSPADHEYQRPR